MKSSAHTTMFYDYDGLICVWGPTRLRLSDAAPLLE